MLGKDIELREFDSFGFHCKGIFAAKDLPAGALVWQYDPSTEKLDTYTKSEILNHPKKDMLMTFSYMVGDDKFGTSVNPDEDPSWCFNHSCDPNTHYCGDDVIRTLRPVKAGEHLCYDYSVTETEASNHYGMKCMCQSKKCRGILTFSEWRSRAFVRKNKGHLTSFIERKHKENSWYDNRLELRSKKDGSMGLFVIERPGYGIAKGEVTAVFAGKVVHRKHMLEPEAYDKTCFELSLQVQKDLWQIPSWTGTGEIIETSDHINHSCDPSCGMKDSVTVVALRDMLPGEEITIDYAMVNDGTIMQPSDNFACRCNSVYCRGKVTSKDYLIPELQQRLGKHFSPFVKHLLQNEEMLMP